MVFKSVFDERKQGIKPEMMYKLFDYFHDQKRIHTRHSNRSVNKAYLVLTLWYTGRRISEIVGQPPLKLNHGIRPMDINEEENKIRFIILKKNPVRNLNKIGKPRSEELIKKERFLRVPPEINIDYPPKFIRMLMQHCRDLQLGLSQRIFPYDRKYVDRVLKEACNKLNLNFGYKKVMQEDGTILEVKKQIGAHSFRHGFSIEFLNRNKHNAKALILLQDYLAHSDINTTKKYLNYDHEDFKESIRRMEE